MAWSRALYGNMLNRFLWCPRAYYYDLTREQIRDICIELALKSPCLRMHFGAIVVKNGKIVGRGFNTPVMNCVNECIRDKIKIIHGTRLELCYAFHAEQRALKMAGKKAKGADLYLVGLNPDGSFVEMRHPKFVACVICAIHECAYELRYIYSYRKNGWSKPVTPKEALETAMMLAKNAESYV